MANTLTFYQYLILALVSSLPGLIAAAVGIAGLHTGRKNSAILANSKLAIEQVHLLVNSNLSNMTEKLEVALATIEELETKKK